MNLKKYDIRHDGGIHCWDEALPPGNGKLGCLLWGTEKLLFSLDRVDLWDNRSAPATLEDGFCYQNLIRLVKSSSDEDWKLKNLLFDDLTRDTVYPTKITAGRLALDFDNGFSPRYHLSLSTGVARVLTNDPNTHVELFMSATAFIGVARIVGNYRMELQTPNYISRKSENEADNDPLRVSGNLDYPLADIQREGEFLYYHQKTHTDFEYGIVVLEKDMGDCHELYFTIATNKNSQNFIANTKEELQEAAEIGYDKLKKAHISWWKRYYAMSEIRIEDELIEKIYYRSQYLFASCSRKGFYPMPLQGGWTADDGFLPPWKGDYHHDTNTQLSYQSYLKANRLSEGEVFIDYLWDLRETCRDHAKNFYGVEGIILPATSTLDGRPIGGWSQYSFSPTMTIWAAQSFDEYYLYTGDTDFLKNRAYPYFVDIATAFEGLLEEKNGKLYLPLSSSPEIHNNRRDAYIEPNSNFDLALLRYLFGTLIGYAEILSLPKAKEKYTSLLDALDNIAVTPGGNIRLSPTEDLGESHRHFSHLMCLYPLHLINYDSTDHRRIYDASILHLERLGKGMWVGFSFTMMAQIYAMAERGNGAYEMLRTFAHGFVADNGFHLNGDFKGYGYSQFHYRPFTLEASFGFCDALHEMLMQDHQGHLHLFAAVPDEWKNKKLSFRDLRSRGGVLVSAAYQNGTVTDLVLKLPHPMTVRIQNNFGTEHLTLITENERISLAAEDGFFELTANGTCRFIRS